MTTPSMENQALRRRIPRNQTVKDLFPYKRQFKNLSFFFSCYLSLSFVREHRMGFNKLL